jgi:hypothetical protein
MASEDTRIDKKPILLTGLANYKDWSRRVRGKLYGKELHTAIWEKDDDEKELSEAQTRTIKRKAYTLILDLVHPDLEDVYDHVRFGEARELWDAFEDKYEKKVEIKALKIRKEIMNCKMKPTETMEEFVLRLKRDMRTLKSLGGKDIPEEEMYGYFLKAIKDKKFITGKRTTLRWKAERRTFKNAAEELIKEEVDVIPFLEEEEENTQPPKNDANTMVADTRGPDTRRKCYYCGKPGHIAGPDDAPICFTKISDKQKGIIRKCIPGVNQPRQPRSQKSDAQPNLMKMEMDLSVNRAFPVATSNANSIPPTMDGFAFILKSHRVTSRNKYFIDSGATEHMKAVFSFLASMKCAFLIDNGVIDKYYL